ncbi:uncharacterized protein LOC111033547 [Myzus persicae]|uniref:uncharacterized protein LOC111033547 n=1 Tax=Myzus persicae TaxID=13164 RepID=UPI000B935785|nr:uncharacterized protein LOC111033547 [Myzus persicae]
MISFLIDCLVNNVTCLSLITIFTGLIYYHSTSTFDKWQKLNIPFIPPVPLFGNIFKMMMRLELPIDMSERVYYKFTDVKLFGFYVMRDPMLFVRDPELIHTILVKDFSYFTDRGMDMDPAMSVLGNSLFFTKGQKWRTMRQKLSPGFTSGKLKDTYSQINECSDEMVSRIVETLSKTDRIDVKTVFTGFSTDVIGTCAFGLKLDAIKNDDSDFRRYIRILFQVTKKQLIVQILMMFCPWAMKLLKIQILPVEATNFFYKLFSDVFEYREEHNVVRNDLTQTLLQARKELVLKENLTGEDKFTDADIIGNAILFFAAGSETISSTLSFCLYELAFNKEIQDKLRAEICAKNAKHNGQLNNDYLTDLNYTNMVLEETARKYTIAFSLMREATKTYTLPDESLVIEKGQKILIPMFSIHRDPKYYPDPLRFDPERFSAEQKSQRPNGTYMPFGDGPRVCIGKRFAESEMKLALSNVLSKFEVSPCEQTEIPLQLAVAASSLISPKNSVVLKFRPIIEAMMISFMIDCLINHVTCVSLITIFTALFYHYSTSTYGKWRKLKIPYVPPVPLFGNTFKMMTRLEHPIDTLEKIYNQFPDHKLSGFYQMMEPMLLVRDPELINRILTKDFLYFTDRGIDTDPSTCNLAKNLFLSNGQKWRSMRQKLSPGFTPGKLKDTYSQINECGDEMVSSIVETIEKKTDHIDLKTLTGRFSTDVIATCAFGLKLDSIKNGDSEFRRYVKMLFTNTPKQMFVMWLWMTCPKVIKFLKPKFFPKEAMNFFHKVFSDVIKYREEHNVIRNDITQTMIQARDELVLKKTSTTQVKFTDDDIICNSVFFFSAGSENISSLLSFCLYELALNKEIQDKLRMEICSMKAKHDRMLNKDYLTDLHYTDMVLEETARKYSIVFILMRQATKTYTLPDESLVIEKGQKILIPMFSIHRDPKYYPDPLRFDPERFSAEQKSQRPNGTYMPFGDGPRVCIGKRFAESEMKLALSNVLSKFEVSPCEQTEIPLQLAVAASSIISPKNSVVLKFRPIIEQ